MARKMKINRFLKAYKLLREGAHYEENVASRLNRRGWTNERIVPIRAIVQSFVLGVMETISDPEGEKEEYRPIPDTMEEVVSLLVDNLEKRYQNRVAISVSPAVLLSHLEEWLMPNPVFASWDDQGVDLEVALSNCAERIEGAVNDYTTIEIPDDKEWIKPKPILTSFVAQAVATGIIVSLPSSNVKLPTGFSTLMSWISFNLFKRIRATRGGFDIFVDSFENLVNDVEIWCMDSRDYLEWTRGLIGEPRIIFEIAKIWLDSEIRKIEGVAQLAQNMVAKSRAR